VSHGPSLYPVYINVIEAPARDEGNFVEGLKSLFSSDRTIRIIRAIAAQARSEEFASGQDEEDMPPF
jgi:hypothetical protein